MVMWRRLGNNHRRKRPENNIERRRRGERDGDLVIFKGEKQRMKEKDSRERKKEGVLDRESFFSVF